MKLKFLIFNFSFLILTACGVTKPVATTHTERIEQHVMPVAVGADTIIIESVFSAGEATASSVISVDSVRNKNSSVRNKNSVKISSTRGVNITRYETDTSTRIKLTLQPDTVFVPYTHHIRSDTIVVPDRICETKLQKTQTANVLLILILIVIFILLLKNRMTR
jgi:hypothetical protein